MSLAVQDGGTRQSLGRGREDWVHGSRERDLHNDFEGSTRERRSEKGKFLVSLEILPSIVISSRRVRESYFKFEEYK